MKSLPVLLVFCLVVSSGCGRQFKDRSPAKQPAGEEKPAAQAAAVGGKRNAEAPVTRKIKYTGNVRLVVDDFPKAMEKVYQLVQDSKGYIAQSEVTNTPGQPRTGHWKVRVPVDQFEAFRKALVGLGTPVRNTTDSEDVTEEFYDLKARIKNKKEEEEGLQKLFKESAGKLEDVLKIRAELTGVRTDIDQLQTRLQTLTKLTDMTTWDVSLDERDTYVPPEAEGFGGSIVRVFSQSWEALVTFGKGIVLVVVVLTPWLVSLAVFAVPLWIFLRRHWRRGVAVPEVVLMEEVAPPPPEGTG